MDLSQILFHFWICNDLKYLLSWVTLLFEQLLISHFGRRSLTMTCTASVLCSCNRGGDSDFRIFHFAVYWPPVNGHCLDTSVKCEHNAAFYFAFYTLPNSHFRISHFIPAPVTAVSCPWVNKLSTTYNLTTTTTKERIHPDAIFRTATDEQLEFRIKTGVNFFATTLVNELNDAIFVAYLC